MLVHTSAVSRSLCGFALLILLSALPAAAQTTTTEALPILMSSDWASQTCEAWNEEDSLKTGLATWIENDADRGYKILRLYRTDCDDSPWVELKISSHDGEARCAEGGAMSGAALDADVDYLMHATTDRWLQMGQGEYGPMKAMMFRRLKFGGPKWEAMKNMGPFASFLELVSAVESDATTCPLT